MSTAVYSDNDQATREQTQWLLRLAAIYLAIPLVIFSAKWLNTGAGIILLILISYGLVSGWSGPIRNSLPAGRILKEIFSKNLTAFALIFVWCCLSIPNYSLPAPDVPANSIASTLRELVGSPWPLHSATQQPLVENFFFYLPAAALGKVFGLTFAQIILFFWTCLGLFLFWNLLSVALLLDRLSNARKLVAALAFVLAGGWDFFGGLLNLSAENPRFVSDLESWAAIGEFSASTTLLFKAPAETIAPWIAAAAALVVMEKKTGQTLLVLLAALSFVWSPLAGIGILPFILILLIRDIAGGNADFFSGSNFFTAPAIFLLGILFYWSTGGVRTIHGQFSNSDFLRNLLLIFLLETVALSLPFFFQHRKPKIYLNQIDLPPPVALNKTQMFFGWTAFFILTFLPFVKLEGTPGFSSQISVPAILVLIFFWIRILKREFTFQYAQIAVTALCLLFGSGAAAIEIYNTLTGPRKSFQAIQTSAEYQNPDNRPSGPKEGRKDSLFWRWIGPQSRLFSPLQ
jgi:hypothetical protein